MLPRNRRRAHSNSGPSFPPQAQAFPRPAGKGLQQSIPQQEPQLHQHRSQPASGRATRADTTSLQHSIRLAKGMRGCILSTTCITHIVAGAMIERGAASTLRGQRPGPKAFGRNVHHACFPMHFRAPNNVIKYDGKTNPSVWLEDYYLTCRAGRADDNPFIIQFLPIYLADTTRAWLDHFPRNSIDCWEDRRS
jgi:hypothetical protein